MKNKKQGVQLLILGEELSSYAWMNDCFMIANEMTSEEGTYYEFVESLDHAFHIRGYDEGEQSKRAFANRVTTYLERQPNVPTLALYTLTDAEGSFLPIDQQTLDILRVEQIPIAYMDEQKLGTSRLEQELDHPFFNLRLKKDQVAFLEWMKTTKKELFHKQSQLAAFQQLEMNKEQVEKSIRNHVAASFAVGFTPIPFADGPILLANQAKMLSKILQVYELGNLSKQIQTVVGALGVGQIVTQFGRYMVGQVVKFVPGIGTFAGGLINGTVASLITTALGLTVSELSYRVSKKKIEDQTLSIEGIMKDVFTKKEAKKLFNQFMKSEATRLKKKENKVN